LIGDKRVNINWKLKNQSDRLVSMEFLN